MQIVVDGPYFEDLHIGCRFDSAPVVTLTEGLAAAHQALLGGRLPLTAAHELSRRVLGDGVLASPSLVWDVAIGQSTVATQTVVANLFYRGVVFRRAPRIGDSPANRDSSCWHAAEFAATGSGRDRLGRPADAYGRSARQAGTGLLAVRDATGA
jgi:hypothetical protein